MPRIIWSILVLSLLLLSATDTLAARWPMQPRDHAYTVEQVSVVSAAGGVTLRGSLLLPAGKGPFPAVVLLPDVGAEDAATYDGELLSSLADSLVRRGVITLRLDERGTGNSEGKAAQTSMADRVADVAAALTKLRAQPQVNAARVGLLGQGRGGNVALLAAAQPQQAAFVVAIAASGISSQDLLAAQVPMYGKLFASNYDKLERQRQRTLGQLQTRQVAFQMQAKGMSSAQVQAYTDQETGKLQEADHKWEEALQKHQRAMLEIVLHVADDYQAQAVLANMLRQRYPNASTEEVQRTAQRMTSPAYRSYLQLNPTATLASVKCPVLLVQGLADAEINPTANLDALEKGLSGNSKVAERRLKDVDHQMRIAEATTAADKKPGVAALVAYSEIGRWIQQAR